MSWKASAGSLETHVKVCNNAKSPVVVFAYNFTDEVFGTFKDSSELQPGASAVLKAYNEGAGKITVGLAIGVAQRFGQGFVEWVDVLASAEYADHRYKLRLRNVGDNSECSIEQHLSDKSLFIAGEKITKCDVGDTWVVQGPSSTGMAILQTIKALRAAAPPAAPPAAPLAAPPAATTDALAVAKPEVVSVKSAAPTKAKKEVEKAAQRDEWEVVGGGKAKNAPKGGRGGLSQRKKKEEGAKTEEAARESPEKDGAGESAGVKGTRQGGGGPQTSKKKHKKGSKSAGDAGKEEAQTSAEPRIRGEVVGAAAVLVVGLMVLLKVYGGFRVVMEALFAVMVLTLVGVGLARL